MDSAFIELGYGKGSITCRYNAATFDVLAPDEEAAQKFLSDAEIIHALDAPIDSPALEDIISSGESVLIVVPDATRASGSGAVVNILARRLIQLGVSPGSVQVIFATGIHRAVTPQEKQELLTPFIYQRIRTLDHHAGDEANLVSFGETEHGTPIELNRAVTEYDHVITIGGINFHYFAGFTGGRKSICPGLASVKTIEATHRLALDFSTGGRRAGVGTGRLFGNPVHEEMERIAAEIAPSLAINTVVNNHNQLVALYAGDPRAAHYRACAEYAEAHTLAISEKREIVIASCGGFPYDINLIQSHKTLDAAAHACADGGAIVLVAECAEGTGRADFMKWFDEPDSVALAERLRSNYEINGQTAWALMTKTERFRVYLVSQLAESDVERMGMTAVDSIEEALQREDAAARGYILPHGARYLPVVTQRRKHER